ncbi:hypothetical protein C0993_005303, partial [Termitomyces sp. T159_Od127]
MPAQSAAAPTCAKVPSLRSPLRTADSPAGEELDAFIKEHGPFDRVVYTGDGSNDFCPILRLR